MHVEQDEAVVPRREPVRASTIEEIKATARRLMAESGTIEARFTDIARAMGMTPPALYRYFSDRDALLTALLTDGYNDLADRLTAAARTTGRQTSGGASPASRTPTGPGRTRTTPATR